MQKEQDIKLVQDVKVLSAVLKEAFRSSGDSNSVNINMVNIGQVDFGGDQNNRNGRSLLALAPGDFELFIERLPKPKIPAMKEAMIHAAYQRHNGSITLMAEWLGCSPSHVSKACKGLNLKPKGRGRPALLAGGNSHGTKGAKNHS